MNKQIKSLVFLFISVAACFCCIFVSRCTNFTSKPTVLSDDLRFCESVLAYNDGLLIANFGGEALNPLNNDGHGYINFYDYNGKMSTLIPADGSLSAPKGMLVIDSMLHIADVNKVVTYDLKDLNKKPLIMTFPEGDLFVNHLVQVGNSVLVSVTNTGNIFSYDITEDGFPLDSTLNVYTNIAGANGLLYHGSSLFVASYPADGTTKEENQIYRIDDLADPSPKAITNIPGHYDGLALQGDALFFTEWQSKSYGEINLSTSEITTFEVESPIDGPAEIDIFFDQLAVPDLVNSKVYIFNTVPQN